MARVLIVDDDAGFRDSLHETLADLGHQVLEADAAAAGLQHIAAGEVEAVFFDLRMPGMDGLQALARLRDRGDADTPPVIMLTAHASGDNTIAAMRLGAFDHLTKPVSRAEVEAVLARALARPAAQAKATATDGGTLLGSSVAIREVQKLIGLAADSTATVLITGETGTGKELVAQALHAHSPRAAHPLVAVNCAAIPAELLESELFGHARGAFTGATQARRGSFQAAEGGTLLLDEVGDMSLAMQAKILRTLETRTVVPVGTGEARPVDVRVLAATHRDLADGVREGTFRRDLYYRLNVVSIHLPPLRNRMADILALAEHFLDQAAPEQPKTLSTAAAARLLAYPWPGNVRELKNAMQRLSVVVRGPLIDTADLGFLATPGTEADAGLDILLDRELPDAVAALERLMIRRALAASGGNRAEAARRLGIRRQLLYDKMARYELD